ncbi:MAG: DUF4215 domain-containing protein [Deltaproteobacteria bacterium]|nr:DUF4215 domain-containing protein [Deltaproteobacteria bacterium]
MTVCRGGQLVEASELDAAGCARDTDGTVVDRGAFGACTYSTPCAETGEKSRPAQLCNAGQATDTFERSSDGCARVTEGTVLDRGPDSGCVNALAPCSDHGTLSFHQAVCGSGVARTEEVTQSCVRSVEGARCAGGADYAACVAEQCTCPAHAPTVCDGACLDTTRDRYHCGACGRVCATDERCVDGACVASTCGNGVVDVAEDCDDGNDDVLDGCVDCLLLSRGACIEPACDPAGAFALRMSAQSPNTGLQLSLGASVAVQGEWAFAGGPSFAGVVHVYRRSTSGWQHTQTLTAADGAVRDEFGAGLAVDDGLLLVGAPRRAVGQEPGAGVVYVFALDEQASWQQRTVLVAADPADGDDFGRRVMLQDGTAVIAAQGWESSRTLRNSGSVYTFTFDGAAWDAGTRLGAPTETRDLFFGADVALDGDRLLVGNSSIVGVAYLFERVDSAWSLRQTFTGTIDTVFGHHVALAGNDVFISAVSQPVPDRGSTGAVYRYTLLDGTFVLRQTFVPPVEETGGWMGDSIAHAGDLLLVGQHTDVERGRVHVFRRRDAEFALEVTLQSPLVFPPDYQFFDDGFGLALATDGETIAIGAASTPTDVVVEGAAYLVDTAPLCTLEGSCACRPGADGPDCALRPLCGDGTRQDAEECDDGNVAPGDGCSALCVGERP